LGLRREASLPELMKRGFCVFAASLCCLCGQAQQMNEVVSLAADINMSPMSSAVSGLTVLSNTLYFTATDGTHGSELWKYDGTTATRLTDLSPGSVNSFAG